MKMFVGLLSILITVASVANATDTVSSFYPPDEAKVKPIKKADKRLRIGVFGLENNPFWIGVKAGTFLLIDTSSYRFLSI
jgi:hypothetical protein